MSVNTAASTVTKGTSSKGNPIVKVGNSIFNRACAADMLAVVDDPAALSVFRGLLVELVGLQAVAMAEKASKNADKVTPPTELVVIPPVVVTPTPAPVIVTPAPVVVSPPKLTTEETIAACQASQNARKDKSGRAKSAKRTETVREIANMEPAATIPVTVTPLVKTPAPETLASLIARAKELKIKGAHLYKDAAKLRAKIDAVAPAPAPMQSKQAKRTLVTSAKGADGNMYAIYRAADGSLVAVADVSK